MNLSIKFKYNSLPQYPESDDFNGIDIQHSQVRFSINSKFCTLLINFDHRTEMKTTNKNYYC